MKILFALSAAVLAAGSFVLTEISISYFEVEPLLVIILGNLAGGGILLLMSVDNPAGWRQMRQRRVLGTVALGALLIYSLAYLMVFNAIALIGAGKAALLGQLETPFVVIFAILFLGEVLTTRHWLAGLLALAGTLLVNFNFQALTFSLGWGELLAILGPVSVAAGIVVLKPLLDTADARQVTGLALVLGALYLMPFVPLLVTVYAVTGAALLAIGAMGFCRGTAWLTYNLSLKRIGASQSAIIFISFAFFTVLLQGTVAWLAPWLGVQLPTNLFGALLGGSLIALGIIILQTAPPLPAEEQAVI